MKRLLPVFLLLCAAAVAQVGAGASGIGPAPSTGAGSSYTAQSWTNGVAASSYPAGVTVNQLSVVAIEIPVTVKTAKISYWINTGDATTSDAYSIGIYNASGALVAHTTPGDWQYAGTAVTASIVEGTVTLSPGIYFIAITGTAATANLYSACGSQKNFALFANAAYVATSSGTMPASITAPTLAVAQGCAPYIVLSQQ